MRRRGWSWEILARRRRHELRGGRQLALVGDTVSYFLIVYAVWAAYITTGALSVDYACNRVHKRSFPAVIAYRGGSRGGGAHVERPSPPLPSPPPLFLPSLPPSLPFP